MLPGILHRKIFGELARVFVPSLLGITGIIVMAGVVQNASQHGLSPAQILLAIPLIVPSMLPFIIPPTTLFATCVVYGRLAHDNEVLAIKAAGINAVYVIWPGMVLGGLMSLTTLSLYYYLIPHTQHLLRSAVIKDVEEFLYTLLRKDHEIKRPDLNLNYEMVVEEVVGKRLKNATFTRRDPKGKPDLIARAREAEIHVDTDKNEVVVSMRHGHVIDPAGKAHAYFEERAFNVPLPVLDKNLRMNPREMTWQELLERRVTIAGEIDLTAKQIQDVASVAAANPLNVELHKHLTDLGWVQREKRRRVDALNAELQMRPALSFGCLFFVLVGCPVGIWFSKSDYLSAFITCFIPIAFFYYPIQLCFTNLAKDGKLHPALALWAANAVVGVASLFLYRKLVKN